MRKKSIKTIVILSSACGMFFFSSCRNIEKRSSKIEVDILKAKVTITTQEEKDNSYDPQWNWSNKESILKTGNIGLSF